MYRPPWTFVWINSLWIRNWNCFCFFSCLVFPYNYLNFTQVSYQMYSCHVYKVLCLCRTSRRVIEFQFSISLAGEMDLLVLFVVVWFVSDLLHSLHYSDTVRVASGWFTYTVSPAGLQPVENRTRRFTRWFSFTSFLHCRHSSRGRRLVREGRVLHSGILTTTKSFVLNIIIWFV